MNLAVKQAQERQRPWPFLRTHRSFATLLATLFVSQIGSQMQLVALLWQVYNLAPSPAVLGAMALMRVVPMLVMALVGGALADRIDRKRLMVYTQLGMLLCACLLAAAAIAHSLTVHGAYLFAAVTGALAACETPARRAFYPKLVPRSHVPYAVALAVACNQVATMLGPILGGLLLAWSGPGWVYAADAASFAIVVVGLIRLPSVGPVGQQQRPRLRDLLEGMVRVRQNSLVWRLLWVDFVAKSLARCTILLPVLARDSLALGPRGYGLLMAGPGFGAMLGVLLPASGRCIGSPLSTLTLALAGAGVGLTTLACSRSTLMCFAALSLYGAAQAFATLMRHTLRQTSTDDTLAGRMHGISLIFDHGGSRLGEIVCAALAVQGGVTAAFLFVALGYFLLASLSFVGTRMASPPA